jgi:hypothetical protein
MEEMLMERKTVYVKNTGEVLSDTVKNIIPKTPEQVKKENDAVRRKDESNEFKMLIDEGFNGFYFYFYEKMKTINMINSMKTRFLYLCSFVSYNTDGSLLVDTDKETSARVPLSKDDIREKLKLGDREFYKTLKELSKNSLIEVNGNGNYCINTDMIFRGKLSISQKKKNYTRMFMEGIKKLYRECSPKQHKQLYYLFMILPNINLRFNCVCTYDTVDKEIESEIETLNMKEMCELIGYNPANSAKITNELFELRIDEKEVMLEVRRHKKKFIKINPLIYYKGTDIKDLQGLISDFRL